MKFLEPKIPFWLVGLGRVWCWDTEGVILEGASCGEQRTQSRKCAGQRMRALMRYQPPSVHNTLARRHMFQARILKQNSSCSFIFRKCWDKLRRSVQSYVNSPISAVDIALYWSDIQDYQILNNLTLERFRVWMTLRLLFNFIPLPWLDFHGWW